VPPRFGSPLRGGLASYHSVQTLSRGPLGHSFGLRFGLHQTSASAVRFPAKQKPGPTLSAVRLGIRGLYPGFARRETPTPDRFTCFKVRSDPLPRSAVRI